MRCPPVTRRREVLVYLSHHPIARTVAASSLVSAILGAGVFLGVRLALARDGVAGGPTTDTLTFTGVLRGVTGPTSVQLTFAFRKGIGSPAPEVCRTVVSGVSVNDHGAFAARVPIAAPESTCTAALFDGADVSYGIYLNAETTPIADNVAIAPVPYARFADQAGMANAVRRPGPYGLTLSYEATAGRLCVQCSGATCSESNPGYVVFAGGVSARVSGNACVTDARTTGGNLQSHPFGTTRTVAWPQDRPFALYACQASSGVLFGLSPGPTKTTTPAASALLSTTTPSGTSETDASLFVWGGTPVSGNACRRIGALRMQKSATDGWTISTLDAQDGIDIDADFGVRWYTMPSGQFGAAAGSYMEFDRTPSADTVMPTYHRSHYGYSVGTDGHVDGSFSFQTFPGDTG